MTKILTKENVLTQDSAVTKNKCWQYDYNHNTTQYLRLADWAKENLISSPGNYVTTKSLFEHSRTLTKIEAVVTEEFFAKEIENIMFALMFCPGRVKSREGRGYRGVAVRKLSGVGVG